MKVKEWVHLSVFHGLFPFAHHHYSEKKQHVPVTSDSFTTFKCFLRQCMIVFATSSLWFPQQLQKHCDLLTKQMSLRHCDEGHSFPEFSSRKDHCSSHRRAFYSRGKIRKLGNLVGYTEGLRILFGCKISNWPWSWNNLSGDLLLQLLTVSSSASCFFLSDSI